MRQLDGLLRPRRSAGEHYEADVVLRARRPSDVIALSSDVTPRCSDARAPILLQQRVQTQAARPLASVNDQLKNITPSLYDRLSVGNSGGSSNFVRRGVGASAGKSKIASQRVLKSHFIVCASLSNLLTISEEFFNIPTFIFKVSTRGRGGPLGPPPRSVPGRRNLSSSSQWPLYMQLCPNLRKFGQNWQTLHLNPNPKPNPRPKP